MSLMADLTFEFMFSGSPPHCGDWHVVRSIMVPDSDRLGMSNPVAPFIYFLESYGGAAENTPWGGTAGLAHELGHQLQGGHVNCPPSGTGSPDWPYTTLPYTTQCHIDNSNNHVGYDPLSDTLIVPLDGSNAPQYNDVMSYGGPIWTSEFVYLRMLDTLDFTRSTQPRAAMAGGGEQQIVGGYIAHDGTAHIEWMYVVDNDTAERMDELINAGNMEDSDYLLRIESENAGVVDVPLRVQEHFGDIEGGLVFFGLFEPVADITVAQLIDNSRGGTPLAERIAGSQAPTITITAPSAGSIITDRYLQISWNGVDNDGDQLLYRVMYSGDGGSSWYEVATTTNESISVDTETLPGGSNGLLRVYASDGLNSSSADVTPLAMPNSAPLVTITPRLNSDGVGGREVNGLVTFPAGSTVEFDAVAFDLEDGPIDESTYSWNADGFIDQFDTGPTFRKNGMQPGFYELTVTTTDSDGRSGTGSMLFRVLPKQVSDGSGVELDGQCEDAGYSADTDPVSLVGPDDNAQLRMVRSGGDYYICISSMNQYSYADEYIELRFDLNNSKDSTMQSSDIYVRLYRDGRFERGVGNGSGGTTMSPPSVLYAGEATSDDAGNNWQAELRIDGSVLPGWNSLIGMTALHKYNSLSLSIAAWSSGSQIGGPSRWGEVALGNAIPPTAVAVQSNAVQPSIGVITFSLVLALVAMTVVSVERRRNSLLK